MSGSIRWNVSISTLGAVIIFLLTIQNNPMNIVLQRSIIIYVILFVVSFGIRFIFGQIFNNDFLQKEVVPRGDDDFVTEESQKGLAVDMSSVSDPAQLQQWLQSGEEQMNVPKEGASKATDQFSPLSPPQLSSQSMDQNEELAKAIRHQLSVDEGGDRT